MIVVDSSVWISALRGVPNEATRKLISGIDTDQILVGDLILLELLRGARTESEASRLERYLRPFTLVEMLNVPTAVKAAANYRLLRRRGITIRSSIDVIIGTFCIESGHSLLQNDRDFLPMAEHLGLELV